MTSLFFVIGIIHGILWLMTKMVIWIALSLFKMNWTSNFWAVYCMVVVTGILSNMRINRSN